jgi:isocitrate dehydrogenase
VNELDNRGSHFYLTKYWSQALANQTKNTELQAMFAKIAKSLKDNEAKINKELLEAQGEKVDIGGYYVPNEADMVEAMRPSETFNRILDSI